MSTSLGHVVIGGGSGFIGKHLCLHLKNKGYGITIISRMPGPQRMSWHDLQKQGLPHDTTAVVNLAGQNVLDVKQRWSEGFKQNVWNSRINTTTSLAKAITNAQKAPKVFVILTGVGVYEPSNITEYNEDSTFREFDFFSKLCGEWEKAAKLPTSVSCRQVIIRSGVVLGHDGGMIKQLYLPFFFGLGGPVSPGNQYLPWIHIDDLIRLITYSIENSHVNGILNGVAPHLITNEQFSSAFARAMKRPSLLPVPSILLNMILGEERASMLTKGQKVIPKKTLDVGFKYLYPKIEDACNAVVNKPKPLS